MKMLEFLWKLDVGYFVYYNVYQKKKNPSSIIWEDLAVTLTMEKNPPEFDIFFS